MVGWGWGEGRGTSCVCEGGGAPHSREAGRGVTAFHDSSKCPTGLTLKP